MKRPLHALIPLLLLVAFTAESHAQIQVGLNIKRRLFIVYEPIIATVTVTNNAGRDITLTDRPGHNWFSFQVQTDDGRVIAPTNPNYQLNPLTIRAGETVKRSVNMTELYAVRDFGGYRIRASIYYDGVGRYFSSGSERIELTEGKTIWEKTVGVPEGMEGGGGVRSIKLLTHRLPTQNMLYARVMAPEEGLVFCTFQLGRVLQSHPPDAVLDRDNNLHVLHLVGPKTYLYSQVGVNGEWRGSKTFTATRTRPHLKQRTDGQVGIVGGQEEVPPEPGAPEVPKLSDRPPGMPEL